MQPVPAPRSTTRSAVTVDGSPAGLGRRFLAAALDGLVLLALGGWLLVAWWVDAVRSAAAGDQVPAPGTATTVAWVLVLAVAVAQWALHGRTGATLGRRVLAIRTLDVETRQPIGMLRLLLRGLVVGAGAFACLVGAVLVLLSPLFDRTGRRRGWHDLAAGDEVLVVHGAAPRPTGGGSYAQARARALDGGRTGPVGRSAVAGHGAPATAAAPHPAEPSTATSPVRVPRWATSGSDAPGTGQPTDGSAEPGTGRPTDGSVETGLVLAPLAPARSGPDLDTRALPIVRATPVVPPPAPAAPVVGLDPELELTRPARRRVDVAPEPPTSGRWTALIELSDGRRLTVDRTALVGRNPAAVSPVQLVRVVDPSRSVSKTHLQIGVEPSGVWVADRGSTNGTVVTLPDGAQVVCQVDHQVRLRVGATVVFGDCWMRLVRAPGAPGMS